MNAQAKGEVFLEVVRLEEAVEGTDFLNHKLLVSVVNGTDETITLEYPRNRYTTEIRGYDQNGNEIELQHRLMIQRDNVNLSRDVPPGKSLDNIFWIDSIEQIMHYDRPISFIAVEYTSGDNHLVSNMIPHEVPASPDDW